MQLILAIMSMSINIKTGITISALQMTLKKDHGNIPDKMKQATPI